jgi:hypothetical protein
MKKLIGLCLVVLMMSSCGRTPKALPHEVLPSTSSLQTIDLLVASISYPQSSQMKYNDEVIADFSTSDPIYSSVGTVTKGTTLNYINIKGIQFLVYGNDGVFATECKEDAQYPDHGPTNPACESVEANSNNTIILCTSTAASVELETAQNWPGIQIAMEDATLGMICWLNGQKMLSTKIFTEPKND